MLDPRVFGAKPTRTSVAWSDELLDALRRSMKLDGEENLSRYTSLLLARMLDLREEERAKTPPKK